MDKEKTQVCIHCGRELPLSCFTIDRKNSNGHCYSCKECSRKMGTNSRWEWMRHNFALEKLPWPFDKDCHAMDIDDIHQSIALRKNQSQMTSYDDTQTKKRRYRKK